MWSAEGFGEGGQRGPMETQHGVDWGPVLYNFTHLA